MEGERKKGKEIQKDEERYKNEWHGREEEKKEGRKKESQKKQKVQFHGVAWLQRA